MATRIMLACLTAAMVVASAQTAHAAGDALDGKRVAERWCSGCHLVGQRGRGGGGAPAFVALANNPAKSERYLKTWITNPHPPMPNFNLSRRTVDDLVAYILSLGQGKRAVPGK